MWSSTRGADCVSLFVAVGFVLAHRVCQRRAPAARARRPRASVRWRFAARSVRRGRACVRQLATESLVLAAAGGAIGVFLAWVGTRALTRLNPANLPRLDAVRIDSARRCSSPWRPPR